MPLTTSDTIEAALGVPAHVAERAEGRAASAEREAREALGSARYDELVAEAEPDAERKALVEAECLVALALTVPTLALQFTEKKGGIMGGSGWDRSRIDLLSPSQARSLAADLRTAFSLVSLRLPRPPQTNPSGPARLSLTVLTTRVKIDYSGLAAVLATGKAGRLVERGLHRGLDRFALDVEADLVGEIDEQGLTDRGDLRQRAFAERVGNGIEYGSSAEHAVFVNEGTRPHWAPLEPLILYVKRKYGHTDPMEVYSHARALQFYIADSGTAAHDFMQPVEDRAQARAAEFIRPYLRRALEGGGAA